MNLIRCFFVKLINEVDTEKHQLIYDSLSKTLTWREDAWDLSLILTLFQDFIKLKHGRRVSHYGIVVITECLNTLLHSNLQKTQQHTTAIKV